MINFVGNFSAFIMNSIQTSVVQDIVVRFLKKLGLTGNLLNIFSILVYIALLFIICWLSFLFFRQVLRIFIRPWLQKLNPELRNVLTENKVFSSLALLTSGFVFYYALPIFFGLYEGVIRGLRILAVIYIIIMITTVIKRILLSIELLARNNERYEKKPINSYIQVVLILSYLMAGVLIISLLIGKSPLTIITAFGAGMAIILLIFKDLILGLVASIQVSVNDMVRVGDWISVDAYNADGPVTEINLTSVKVRNWDRTVSNIPTYALVSQGFRNVREMEDLGVRRFLHHLLIDIRSIKEVDDNFIENLKSKELFKGEKEALSWSENKNYQFYQVKTITNLSLFRKYVEDFLLSHPGIDKNYIVVRQLQQKGEGLPIEVYAWVKSVSFKPLHAVQSDIFEHLNIISKEFDLILFQKPSGNDIQWLRDLSTNNNSEVK